MAYLVRLSPRATDDLTEISFFIQADISSRASAWFQGLESAIDSLAEMPRRYPERLDRPGVHQQLYGSGRNTYRVLYRIDEKRKRVLVLRIRHGARQGSGV